MYNLSYKQKLSIARQLNLVVRTINDFQLVNWKKRNETVFNELQNGEKKILSFAGCLVEDLACVSVSDPVVFVNEIVNFIDDLRIQLKYCQLNEAVDLITKSNQIFASILQPALFSTTPISGTETVKGFN